MNSSWSLVIQWTRLWCEEEGDIPSPRPETVMVTLIFLNLSLSICKVGTII